MIALSLWTPASWPKDRWPNFSYDELVCRETGANMMDEGFMDLLQELRNECGFGLPITSGFRHEEHSIEAAKVRKGGAVGSHTFGMAVDINVWGDKAYTLEGEAYKLGFTGIGSQQSLTLPPEKRFTHLDTLTPEVAIRFPRPHRWSY